MSENKAVAAADAERNRHLVITATNGSMRCDCGRPLRDMPSDHSRHVIEAVVSAVLQSVIEGAESLYPLDRSTQDRVKWAVARAEGSR